MVSISWIRKVGSKKCCNKLVKNMTSKICFSTACSRKLVLVKQLSHNFRSGAIHVHLRVPFWFKAYGGFPIRHFGSKGSREASRAAEQEIRAAGQQGIQDSVAAGQPARRQSKCIGESMFTSRFPGPNLVPRRWAQIWGTKYSDRECLGGGGMKKRK